MEKQMKGITCCGDCAYYSFKKHKCTRCDNIETDARSHFYDDCPLPDVIEKNDKYKWHDLRKNPEDLPIEMSICLACMNIFGGKQYDLTWYIGEFRRIPKNLVIAWKYIDIEPFEEE